MNSAPKSMHEHIKSLRQKQDNRALIRLGVVYGLLFLAWVGWRRLCFQAVSVLGAAFGAKIEETSIAGESVSPAEKGKFAGFFFNFFKFF